MKKITNFLYEELTRGGLYFIILISVLGLIIGNPLNPQDNFMIVWKTAGRHILGLLDLEPNTLYYMPENALNFNPDKAGGYVYAPNFAILLSILFAPFSLILLSKNVGFSIPEALIPVIESYEYLVIGLVVYLAFVVMLVFAAAVFESQDKQIAVVFLLSQSPVVMQLGKSDVEVLLVVSLVFAAYKFTQLNWWGPAGLSIGLSVVNWTTTPLVLVFLAYVFKQGKLCQKRKAVIGVIASQLSQILYFSTQPDELIVLIQQQGNLATPLFNPSPFVELILIVVPSPEVYQSVVKPLLLIFFVAVGIYMIRKRCTLNGLLAGFLLAMFPVSYLFSRPSAITFTALTLLLSIKIYDRNPIIIGTLIAFFTFIEITDFFPVIFISESSLSYFIIPLIFAVSLFLIITDFNHYHFKNTIS
jgi:hypothetical protein